MHCGAVDYQSSYEHAISDLAQRSLIIVCKYCGESRVEKKTIFLVNYKCVWPNCIYWYIVYCIYLEVWPVLCIILLLLLLYL